MLCAFNEHICQWYIQSRWRADAAVVAVEECCSSPSVDWSSWMMRNPARSNPHNRAICRREEQRRGAGVAMPGLS